MERPPSLMLLMIIMGCWTTCSIVGVIGAALLIWGS